MSVIRIKGLEQASACASVDLSLASICGEVKEVDSGECDEDKEAARILCSMKTAKVDEETLAKLWQSVKRTCNFESHMVSDENIEDREEERDNNVRDDVAAPDRFPRGRGLEGIMGERSEPFEKMLTGSDVDDVQARLNLRKDCVVKHILPLLREGEDIHAGISVTTYNSNGVGYPMAFKVWCRKSHVLTSGWIRFVHENNLKERLRQGISVQVFRHVDTDELSFLVSPAGN